MHSLLHTEVARAVADRAHPGPVGRAVPEGWVPTGPPGRLRAVVAHVLGTAAGRVERNVARRAVA